MHSKIRFRRYLNETWDMPIYHGWALRFISKQWNSEYRDTYKPFGILMWKPYANPRIKLRKEINAELKKKGLPCYESLRKFR